MLIDFLPDNPLRRPNWRWERARTVIEDQIPLSRRRDDKYVRRATDFRRALLRCHDELQHYYLATHSPDMYWAWKIATAEERTQANLLRADIEARILARSTDVEIAEKCDVKPAVVDNFANVFFGVRDRLDRQSYITHQVIGTQLHEGLRVSHFPVIWKLFAYYGGPIVLDALITTFTDPYRPGQASDMGAFIKATAMNDMMRQAMLAAKTYNLNNFTQADILQLYTQVLTIQQTATTQDQAQESFLANIGAMMQAVAYKVGPPKRIDAKRIASYDSGAAELRMGESLQAMTGHRIAAVDQNDWQYPPKPERRPEHLTDEE